MMIELTVTPLRNYWEKSIGLSGKTQVYPVYFSTRWGIHTLGVRLPLDIIILDEKYRVTALREHLLPNRFFFWNPTYNNVVELPAGVIRKKSISIGDTIILHTTTTPSASLFLPGRQRA